MNKESPLFFRCFKPLKLSSNNWKRLLHSDYCMIKKGSFLRKIFYIVYKKTSFHSLFWYVYAPLNYIMHTLNFRLRNCFVLNILKYILFKFSFKILESLKIFKNFFIESDGSFYLYSKLFIFLGCNIIWFSKNIWCSKTLKVAILWVKFLFKIKGGISFKI